MDPLVVGFVVVAIIVVMGWLRWRSGKAEMKALSPSDSTPVAGSLASPQQLAPSKLAPEHKEQHVSEINSPATLAFLDEMEQRARDSGDPAGDALAKVQALKHYMQTTGGSLSDALRHRDGDKIPAQLPAELDRELRVYLQKGQKIEAIKRLRQATGSGLKEAKEVVEKLERISNS